MPQTPVPFPAHHGCNSIQQLARNTHKLVSSQVSHIFSDSNMPLCRVPRRNSWRGGTSKACHAVPYVRSTQRPTSNIKGLVSTASPGNYIPLNQHPENQSRQTTWTSSSPAHLQRHPDAALHHDNFVLCICTTFKSLPPASLYTRVHNSRHACTTAVPLSMPHVTAPPNRSGA